MIIRILHQSDFRIEAAKPLKAFLSNVRCAANEKRLIEQHSPSEGEARSKSATDRCFSSRVGKVLTFMLQLCRGVVTKRFNPTEYETYLWVRGKRCLHGLVMPVC